MITGMPDEKKLMTLAQFMKLSPRARGYVSYMEGNWPGSELKDCQANPYEQGTSEFAEFESGQMMGVLEAQDGDD